MEPSGIAIPQSWIKDYFPLKISQRLLEISLVKPLALDEVVLVAKSQEAFEAASEEEDIFYALYAEECIIRQGDTLNLPASPISYRYAVESTDPLLQGFLKKGSTRIVVLLGDEDLSSESDSEDLTDESMDGIEIDSSFLASSALSKPMSSHQMLESDTLADPSRLSNAQGHAPFRCMPLSFPISVVEDDSTLYVRTSDLSRLGILNSDWVSFSFPQGVSHILTSIPGCGWKCGYHFSTASRSCRRRRWLCRRMVGLS